MNWTEAAAVLFGLACVSLTVRQNIWCWPTGLVQVILYIAVFYHAHLYSDLILQVIYVIMQVYGWYFWLHGGPRQSALPVTRQSAGTLAAWVALAVASAAVWGFFMATYTDAAVPYGDALIVTASLIAQWLLARKQLEAWYFWIGVDLLALGVYSYKALYLTTGLYAVFLVLAIIGYRSWLAAINGHSENNTSDNRLSPWKVRAAASRPSVPD